MSLYDSVYAKVPLHRRPFWAKTEHSYRCHMNAPLHRTATAKEPKKDVFSFEAGHLDAFKMPAEIAEGLPDDLLAKFEDWQKAGAALLTSLDRVERSHGEAMSRAFPTAANYSHNIGKPEPEKKYAEVSAATSPQVAPSAKRDISVLQLEKSALLQFLELAQARPAIGMESPPFSPVGSFGCGTPVNPLEKHAEQLSDLAALRLELTPGASPETIPPTSPNAANFDEISWEYYVKFYQRERLDGEICLGRLAEYAHAIETHVMDWWHATKPAERKDRKVPILVFTHWWVHEQRKVTEQKVRLEGMKCPDLAKLEAERDAMRARYEALDLGYWD